MPRQSRYFYPGIVLHVVQRGNDRAPVFVSPDDRQYYLAYWSEAARIHDVRL
jgi:REP-associated tyrosine transposase